MVESKKRETQEQSIFDHQWMKEFMSIPAMTANRWHRSLRLSVFTCLTSESSRLYRCPRSLIMVTNPSRSLPIWVFELQYSHLITLPALLGLERQNTCHMAPATHLFSHHTSLEQRKFENPRITFPSRPSKQRKCSKG